MERNGDVYLDNSEGLEHVREYFSLANAPVKLNDPVTARKQLAKGPRVSRARTLCMLIARIITHSNPENRPADRLCFELATISILKIKIVANSPIKFVRSKKTNVRSIQI